MFLNPKKKGIMTDDGNRVATEFDVEAVPV